MKRACARSRKSRRLGFTLIELTVVIGICMLLLALILPAVHGARQAAHRAACANKLRQLALAVNNFAAGQGGMPTYWTYSRDERTGKEYASASMFVALLPYLEQSSLYNSLNLRLFGPSRTIPPWNQTAAAVLIDVLICPADGASPSGSTGPTSYRVNGGERVMGPDPRHGPFAYLREDVGAFTRGAESVTPGGSYRDGTSHTLAFSEKPIGRGPGSFDPPRTRLVIRDFTADTPDQWLSQCARLDPQTPALGDAGGSWYRTGIHHTEFLTAAPPASPIVDCGEGEIGRFGLSTARSFHGAGAHAALIDGSVRWFSQATSLALWRALGTRQGGEIAD
jgi:type II secretory pathway pseudopilin PulG